MLRFDRSAIYDEAAGRFCAHFSLEGQGGVVPAWELIGLREVRMVSGGYRKDACVFFSRRAVILYQGMVEDMDWILR